MLKFVFKYLEIYKIKFLFVLFCSVLTATADLLMPYLTAKFIDEILESRDLHRFYCFILVLIAINVLSVITNWVYVILSTKIQANVINELIEDLIRRVQKIQNEFLFNTDMIYLSKRIEKDATDLISIILGSLIDVSIQVILLLMSVFLLYSIGVKWVLMFFIIAFLHFVIYRLLKQSLLERSTAARETESQYFTAFSDNFLYIYSIKLHSLYDEFTSKFRTSFEEYFKAGLLEAKINFWFAYSRSNSSKIFNILIFLLGGFDVLNHEMTVGNFVALNGYYHFAMQSVSYFMGLGQGYQNAKSAYMRILEIEEQPIESNGETVLEKINIIELNNVKYQFNKQVILNDFTYTFERGKIYCIVGKNGAGKTTLLNVICNLLKPQNGEVKYNNTSISNIDMIDARKRLIAVVEQKDFIKNDNLSGGERRKLSIKKALSKSADVLIMDEPDNNLDSDGMKKLIEFINTKKKNQITLIITHDDKLIEIADEVVNI